MPIIEKNSDEVGFLPAGGFAMTALTGFMHVPDMTVVSGSLLVG